MFCLVSALVKPETFGHGSTPWGIEMIIMIKLLMEEESLIEGLNSVTLRQCDTGMHYQLC